ncbi:GNAT family N-acetyltransferase [Occultella glacieicola]|uniref:GNAT family N-acetyltransferase n=1 Tax=Occultella glacieicola TaxID=2518684 RepID=A0ABY2DYW8_9MICO|nr:GNAT family N-acetyltransferase [Occultella glacieicola]TDE88935.1 GNAT family N-acetyltransferase [Occultella glacieicola]
MHSQEPPAASEPVADDATPAPEEPQYPAHWEADVVLRDGSTARIRPIRPDDADALQRFHARQSPESTYLRFFAPMERLGDRDLHRFTHVDHVQRVALVLLLGEEIVAVGRFDRIGGGGDAEVAFNVLDVVQGKGLGSVLLEHLAAAARELGVRRFVADVLPQNTRMMRVFSDAGYDVDQSFDDGVLSVSFTIRPTDRSLAVLAEREQRAEALSMAGLLDPAAVLVYAAGPDGAAFGERLRAAIDGGGYAGTLRCVGLPGSPATLPDVADAGPFDLALVAAPAVEVTAILADLAALGVQGVVVYSGGFTTATHEGRVTQRVLVRAAREAGLRLVGPHSFGLVTGGDHGHLNATLAPRPLREGAVGLFCQSGAAGLALVTGAADRDLGVASFLSAGHRVDVSGNDTMQFWLADPRTRVSALRFESIGNPRKFSRVARRLSEKGPVITMIAGTTGQLNPPGHAVRISREPPRALDELMRQAGVIRAETIPELLDLATLFSEQPLPAGGRVLVLTNSGTQGAVIAELLDGGGLRVAGAPVALPPTAGPGAYRDVVDAALARDDWDAAIVAYVPILDDEGAAVAPEIARLAAAGGRTTVACVFGIAGLAPELAADGVRVPGFATVEAATHGLVEAVRYHEWRSADRGRRIDPVDVDRRRAKELVQAELAGLPRGTTRRLSPERTSELLAAYGLHKWPEITVTDADSAVAAAEELGWPVALKTSDEVLRHRADLGGVRLDLSTPAELREAFAQGEARVQAMKRRGTTFDVQSMAPTGAACVVRATEDELYGPIISAGLGGDAVELLGDVSYRVPPLTDVDALEMVRSLRASARLFGHRGLPALDVDALTAVIGRISVLKDELAEVASITLNPVLVAETGAAILGARVDVAHPARGDAARRVLP